MRLYRINERDGATYTVPASPAPLTRPTRNAAGMSATDARRRRRYGGLGVAQNDALRLMVRGTLDPLAQTRFDLTRRPCGCCGSTQNGGLMRKPKSKPLTRLSSVRLDPDRLP